MERTLSPTNTSISSPAPLLFRDRLTRTIQANGLSGVIAHTYYHLLRPVSSQALWRRAFHSAATLPSTLAPEPPHPFDLAHGIDTGGYISRADPRKRYRSACSRALYHSIPPSALSRALADLPLFPENFTFVNLACGKARGLFVAAEFPFRNLLGVEVVPELAAAARANIAGNPDWASRAAILNQDPATVTYPDTPLVLFLFNPLLAPALRRTLANLERQFHRLPRETYLICANHPRLTRALERFRFLREIANLPHELSAEDAAVDESRPSYERFRVYTATLTG
jgi:hypothetical protein